MIIVLHDINSKKYILLFLCDVSVIFNYHLKMRACIEQLICCRVIKNIIKGYIQLLNELFL